MKFKILTIFPQMIENALSESILGRARSAGIIGAEAMDIRPFSASKHKNTDDTPFGGGAGMVMTPQPLADCINAAKGEGFNGKVVYLSPRGETFSQKKAEEYSKLDGLIMLCGHYEGIDQRIIDKYIDEEISVGDYVLTGGELGALIITDAVARLIPGVLGCDESSVDESFSSGLLEYPQYTRPREFEGMAVPEVLLGGNQKLIDRWRRDEAVKVTFERRPELLDTAPLDRYDRAVIRNLEKPRVIRVWMDERDDEMLSLLSEEGYGAFEYSDTAETADAFICMHGQILPETDRPVYVNSACEPRINVMSAAPCRFSAAVYGLIGDEGIKQAEFSGFSKFEFASAAAALLPVKRALRYRADYGKNRSACLRTGAERRVTCEFFDGSTKVCRLPRIPRGFIKALAAFLSSGASPVNETETLNTLKLFRLMTATTEANHETSAETNHI